MIRLSPYPQGKAFAITFVDDTDFSTRENTEPVYEVLAKSGFWGTKTVWPTQARRSSAYRRDQETQGSETNAGSTLEDSDYAQFVQQLKQRGFEIALHGVASGNSTRTEIQEGLTRFRAIVGGPPSINAFHKRNIENLYCGLDKLDVPVLRLLERVFDGSEYEGHREGTPSFWGDLVREIAYVRLPFHTIDDVNTLRLNPTMPFSDQSRPWVRQWFAASDGGDVVRFNRLLSESNVQRLERERGACVIYTHFAKLFARRVNQCWVLDAEFVATVERVTGNPAAWFTTASRLLDRLAAVRQVGLRHKGTELSVTNVAETDLESLVLLVPQGMNVQSEIGATLNVASDTVVLPKIGRGESLRLRSSLPGNQTIDPGSPEIPRRERRRIEYANYRGLVRGAIRDKFHYMRRDFLRRWRRETSGGGD